jgi:hypothetical protein
MTDAAAFQGIIVDGPKNYGTHKEVVLKVHFPAEFGAAIVAALGWPTRVNPVHVAVARLEERTEKPAEAVGDVKASEPKRFEDLSDAEQVGILCKDPDFKEFLETSPPYSSGPDFSATWTPEDMVRDICGVRSRPEMPYEHSRKQWRLILDQFQAWRAVRDRSDPDF